MSARLDELIRVATGLVDQIANNAQGDLEAFREAYRLGFECGKSVGRLELDRELTELDRLRAAYIHALGSLPSYRDLEHRRWDGRREDFGRPRPGDFPGVPPEIDRLFFCPTCQEARGFCTCKGNG